MSIIFCNDYNWKKTASNVREMAQVDSRLWDILEYMDRMLHADDKHVTVTAVWYQGGSGVHEAFRAVDVRSHELNIQRIRQIEWLVNKRFPRSDGKPTCLYHDVGQGPHFHLQVPPGTSEMAWDRMAKKMGAVG